VCLSSEEEADTIASDVQKNADTGASATQEQQQAGLPDEDGDSSHGEGEQFAEDEEGTTDYSSSRGDESDTDSKDGGGNSAPAAVAAALAGDAGASTSARAVRLRRSCCN
jgi:hypothetical protein